MQKMQNKINPPRAYPLARDNAQMPQPSLPQPAFESYGVLTDQSPQNFDEQINKFSPYGNAVIEDTPNQFRDHIYKAAKQHQIPAREYSALLKTEGGFRPEVQSGQVRSSVGAAGVNQFMPNTIQELDRIGYGKIDPLKPEQSIPAGAFYLRHLMESLGIGDDFYGAAQAYNAGPGNFRKYGGNVPYQETQNYVGKIRDLSR